MAVTAEDLRAGQGYVRCGRCLNVFNALQSLREEAVEPDSDAAEYSQANPASASQISRALELAAGSAPSLPPPPSLVAPDAAVDPTAVTDEHEILQPEAHETIGAEDVMDPVVAESPAEAPHPQLATEVSGDGAFENESSYAEGTGTFETIVLEGDGITQTEEFAPQETVDHEMAVLAQRSGIHRSTSYGARAGASENAAAGDSSDAADVSDDAAQLAGLGLRADPTRPESAIHHRRGWLAGCVLLGLLLIVQAINHWRDALASMPSISAPMTRLYGSLGIALDPHWDLNAYDIRQQGAVSDPADTHIIRVRLSVANRAARAQPVPLLRLTLLDRYGKRIAARDLNPEDYWPHGQTPHSFLGHDERVDSEVAVRDQGPDSASFELDVCLRSIHGVVRCAGDASVAAAGP